MIVQCDKCKTKFRIADEKVTDAGVKVRCSRCAHVFMVRRGATGAIEIPIAASTTNPSLDLGLRDPTIDPGAGVPTIPSSLPAFTGRPRGFAPTAPMAPSQSYIPNLSIPSLAPEPASQRPGPSTSFDAMFALGFSAPPANAQGPEAETQQVALPQRARPRAVSDPFSGWQPDAELARQLGFDDDPTASYSAATPLSGGTGSPAMPAGATPTGASPLSAFAFTSPDASADPSSRADQQRTRRYPLPPFGAHDAEEPDRPRTSPGTIASSIPGQGARSSAGTIASSIPGQGARSSAGTLSVDGAPSSTSAMIGASIASTLGEEPVPSGVGPVLFPPPPELASLLGSLQSSASPSASGGAPGGSDLGDIPGLLPAGAQNDDPFANLDLDGPVFTGSGYAENTGNNATPFDDANDKSTYSIAKQGASSQSAQPLAKITLEKSASEFSASLATTRVSTALPFPERKVPRRPADGPGGWPTLLGLALGLGVVALAVTGPAGGSLSRFGPETLFALVSPDVSAPLEPLLDSVDVSAAHVTAYATRAGKSLLVVAGNATNEGTDVLPEIEAIATIFDGATVVERREALVGLTIPEDVLANVTGAKDLDAAYEAALSDSTPDARTLGTGATRPFMIVFPEVPADVAERTFVVEFRRANRQPTAPAP